MQPIRDPPGQTLPHLYASAQLESEQEKLDKLDQPRLGRSRLVDRATQESQEGRNLHKLGCDPQAN